MTNPIQLHRTPEWGRLKRTGFFKIEDRPGEIVVSKGAWPVFVGGGMVLASCLPLLFSHWMLPLTVGFGGIWAWATLRTLSHGYKVRFTPDELVFYGPLGVRQGSLQRVAMQQIAVKTTDEKRDDFCHEFIADTGWMQAFWGRGKTRGSVQNNVLMAAFAQPIHLDLLREAPAFDVESQPQLHLQPRGVS